MAKILLVEDDPNHVRIVERILSRSDHELIHVTSGEEALKCVAELYPDLVLLDMGLPDMNGQEVINKIGLLPTSPPIVAVTGDARINTVVRAMSFGCIGYITKPIDTRTFLDDIERYIFW